MESKNDDRDANRREDELFAALLASLKRDAVAPDPQLRERLRIDSLAAFVNRASSLPQPKPRIFRVLVAHWRTVAATTVAGLVLWFWLATNTSSAAPTLGEALAKLEAAQTIHAQIEQAGKAGEVWVARPGRLRWNDPDGTYQIAQGRGYGKSTRRPTAPPRDLRPIFPNSRPGPICWPCSDSPRTTAAAC